MTSRTGGFLLHVVITCNDYAQDRAGRALGERTGQGGITRGERGRLGTWAASERGPAVVCRAMWELRPAETCKLLVALSTCREQNVDSGLPLDASAK